MTTLALVACFFGGMFLANALPHLVSGMQGRSFQSPFAKPRGKGLSSSTINVLWGFFNAVVGYVLLRRADLAWSDTTGMLVCAAGALLIALFCSWHFGQFHGGRESR